MAAFSTMALIGGGLLAGAAATKLATRNKKQEAPLAPGPTGAGEGGDGSLAPPAPPILDPGATQAAAGQAAQKTRRKQSANGTLLGSPGLPKSSTQPVAPRYAQRTLLGS